VIPTLPVAARNRLAAVILRAVDDPAARSELEALGTQRGDPVVWLGPDGARHADRLRARALAAARALAGVAPVAEGIPGLDRDLDRALDVAAALFDAGLGFETHEVLEPHWVRAHGAERDALQGLIQVAVGYQHLANGNASGARSLLGEGAARLGAARLRGRAGLGEFAVAVRAALVTPAAGPPPFPRGDRDPPATRG
jgi:hypothetical protein